jgi:diaminopimelate epimerase
MTRIKFTKMHGLGNDYVYFDCVKNPSLIPEEKIESIAQQVSDRHFGVGGDGIVLMLSHDTADFQMRMINADGSEAEMCGNAIRCVGKYLFDMGHTDQNIITIMTGAGILTLVMTVESGKVSKVRVDMGEPILNGLAIPTTFDLPKVVSEPYTLSSGKQFDLTCVSMGNPHCIIFVDEITDENISVDGKELEVCPLFPNRINVEFAKVHSREEITMRVWERGTGETMACGTGATATGVAAMLNGLTDRKVVIHLLGGDLEIEWDEESNHVFMTGPATFAFTGEIDLEL